MSAQSKKNPVQRYYAALVIGLSNVGVLLLACLTYFIKHCVTKIRLGEYQVEEYGKRDSGYEQGLGRNSEPNDESEK